MFIVYVLEISLFPTSKALTSIEPPWIVPTETNPAKILVPSLIKLAGKQPKKNKR